MTSSQESHTHFCHILCILNKSLRTVLKQGKRNQASLLKRCIQKFVDIAGP